MFTLDGKPMNEVLDDAKVYSLKISGEFTDGTGEKQIALKGSDWKRIEQVLTAQV